MLLKGRIRAAAGTCAQAIFILTDSLTTCKKEDAHIKFQDDGKNCYAVYLYSIMMFHIVA